MNHSTNSAPTSTNISRSTSGEINLFEKDQAQVDKQKDSFQALVDSQEFKERIKEHPETWSFNYFAFTALPLFYWLY